MMTHIIRLETTRFILRQIEPGDVETLHAYWSDDIVTEYMNTTFNIGRSLYGCKRYDEFEAFLNWLAEYMKPNT